MVFSYNYGKQKKGAAKKECTSDTGHFDSHSGVPEQYRLHHPMQHVQGYSRSHWMLPMGDYSLRITQAAARAAGKQTTINKYTYYAGHVDGRGGAPVQYSVHCLMEEVQGFGRSHWMAPSGKYCGWIDAIGHAYAIFFLVFSS